MSFRYPAGLLTAASPVNAQYPSGVWTQQQAAQYQAQGVFATDPNFRYTTMLLNGNGTNGAQNNTFLDSSTNNFSITRNGNATQGTFSPYVPSGFWSMATQNTTDTGIGVATNAVLNLGTSNFTIECWIYLNTLPTSNSWTTSAGGYQAIFATGPNSSATGSQLYIGVTNILFDVVSDGSGPINVAHGMSVGVWYHVALTRSGSTISLYKNGVLLQSGTDSNSMPSGYGWGIGRAEPLTYYSGGWFNGYISNFRLVSGSVVYTSAFTPPTSPLTAISGTQLLLCQSNRFIDNSSNNFTVGLGGNAPSVQSFQPFPRTVASSAAVTGGSGYFDGTGDYLTVSSNTALNQSGDFTHEAWLYLTAYPASLATTLYAFETANFLKIGISTSGQLICDKSQVGVQITGSVMSLNTWYHVALVRSGSGSNNVTLYLNGASAGTATGTDTVTVSGTGYIARRSDANNVQITGYVSNLRVTNTAVYTGAFTPPTAPLTAISGTSLLLSTTNAGIQDSTMANDLETVGNAQVSTSVVKYGTGSLYFDGSGDYLTANAPPAALQISSAANFTFEYWIYVNSFLDASYNLAFGMNSKNYCGVCSTSIVLNGDTDPEARFSTPINTGTWYHIAFCRSSGTLRAFVNGTQVGSNVSDSKTYFTQQAQLNIGAMNSGSFPLNGYLDEFRITKGYARYTANFTPPIAPFPKQ